MCALAEEMEPFSNSTVSQRAIAGGFWVLGIRIVNQAFSLARLVILARFLDSYDFGLMGIALLTMTSIDTFSQTGFHQALIQKRGDIRDYLDSAWTFLVLRGVAVTLIIFAIAPYSSDFFNAPEASLVVGVTGLSMLFLSFTNIGVIYFQKELDFRKQFIYVVGGSVADFTVAVSAVIILGSVWALVFGLLAGHFVRMLISYLIHTYRPKWSLDFRKARELFGFGKWILGSAILIFLATQMDSIVVGTLVGVTALGFYQMAYSLASAPTSEIAHVVNKVTFPAYAMLQENLRVLRAGYLKALKVTSYVSFGMASFIIVLAEDFTLLFLGEKWAPIVPVMQILVVAGAIRSVAATTGPVFIAMGKPKIDTIWQILRLAVLFIAVFPLALEWGINGAALAVLTSISISAIGFTFSVVKITGCGRNAFIRTLTVPLLISIPTVCAMILIKAVLQVPGFAEFATVIAVGLSAWWLMTSAFDRYWGYGMMAILRTMAGSLRPNR
jgi:lipopolysaccharide exporter